MTARSACKECWIRASLSSGAREFSVHMAEVRRRGMAKPAIPRRSPYGQTGTDAAGQPRERLKEVKKRGETLSPSSRDPRARSGVKRRFVPPDDRLRQR